mgnify:FL=1
MLKRRYRKNNFGRVKEILKMISPRLKEFVRAMSLEGMALSPAPPLGGDAKVSAGFSIEDVADCYRISGMEYRNRICQIDLSKALLPSGTQEEHAQRRKQALSNNDFYTTDFRLFHGVINALYQNREGPFKSQIESARASLSGLMNGKWLMTLTRIRYAPTGQDSVIHNYKQDDQYEVAVDFVGPDGFITKQETNAAPALQALLSTQQSPQEIDQVYKWLRSKDAYLWRVNSRPEAMVERVAGFFADSDWSVFYCFRGPQFSGAAFGVRLCAAGAPKK